MSSSSTRMPTPEGRGSVSGAPDLLAGFADTFTSRYVDTGELRQHVVTGGDGPPLLLVHGWPETWYAWRLVMPGLARDFQVVAVDQRGIGLSGKPAGGYDTGTLASDLVALMDALGHRRIAVAGHDTGLWIGYALAADHPDRVDCLAVAEAAMPGVSARNLSSQMRHQAACVVCGGWSSWGLVAGGSLIHAWAGIWRGRGRRWNRSGWARQAASRVAARRASMATQDPSCTVAGVCIAIPECLCSLL